MSIALRLRPLSDADRKQDAGTRTFALLEGGTRVAVSDPLKQFPDSEFSFTSIHAGAAPSEGLYEATCASLVPKLAAGTSCVCWIMGQSGSGKSFTLAGARDSPGLVRCATRDLLREIKALRAAHVDGSFVAHVSAMEIHCEHVVDLLRPYMEVPFGAPSLADDPPPVTAEQAAKQVQERALAAAAVAAAAASPPAGSPPARRPDIKRIEMPRSRRGSTAQPPNSGASTAREPLQAPPSAASASAPAPARLAKQLSVANIDLMPELMTARRIHVHEQADGRVALPDLARLRVTSPEETEAAILRALANRGIPRSRAAYDRHNAQVVVSLTLSQDFARNDGSLERRSLVSALHLVVTAAGELTTMDSAAFAPEQASAFRVLKAVSSVLEALSKRNLAFAFFDGCLLTRLLRPHLGLQSHVAVIGCVHPRLVDFTESRATIALLGETHRALQAHKGLDRTDAVLRERDASIRALIKELADAKAALAVEREAALEARIALSQLKRETGAGAGATDAPGGPRGLPGRSRSPVPNERATPAAGEGGGGGGALSSSVDEAMLIALQDEKRSLYESMQAQARQYEAAQTDARRREAEHSVELTRLKRALRDAEAAVREGEARHAEAERAARSRFAAELSEVQRHQDALLAKQHRLLEASLRDVRPASTREPAMLDFEAAKERLAAQYRNAVAEMERTLATRIAALESRAAALQSELAAKTQTLAAREDEHARYADATGKQLSALLAYVQKLQILIRRLERGTYPVHATPIARLLLAPPRRGESVHSQVPGLLAAVESAIALLGEESPPQGTPRTPRVVAAEAAAAAAAEPGGAVDLHKSLKGLGERALRAEIGALRAHILASERASSAVSGERIRDAVLRDLQSDGTATHIRRLETELASTRAALAAEQERVRALQVSSAAQERGGARPLSPLVRSSLGYAAQRQGRPVHAPFDSVRRLSSRGAAGVQ